MDVLESESPFVAHKVPLGLRILPRPKPIDFVFILIDMDAATCRATSTDALGMLEPPNAFLVEEVFAAQGADRAKINHVSSELIVAWGIGEYINLFMRSTSHDLEFCRAADFPGESNTARTHHASIGKQSDLLADVVLVLAMQLRFVESTMSLAIFVGVVLQIAFTRLIADGAIQRVVEQE